MTDLYIATPAQADYNALMRLAEAAGYEWYSGGAKPTALNLYYEYVKNGGQVIHFGVDSKALMQCGREYFEKMGATIETIPNLAGIKAVWKVSRENRNAFTMKHRLPPHYKSARKLYVICDEYSETYTTEENEIYEALATEYKLQESEVMPEKVKLPRPIYNVLMAQGFNIHGIKRDEGSLFPITTLWGMATVSDKSEPSEYEALTKFLYSNSENQWKLIDALRYGYEPEPNPRWGIKAGSCYMDAPDSWGFDNVTPKVVIDNDAYWTIKKAADEIVKTLGFGAVVDLNKEGKANGRIRSLQGR